MPGPGGRRSSESSDSSAVLTPTPPGSPWSDPEASDATFASSLHPLPLGDEIESTLQTLSLSHLKGADHAGELREQLERWHTAFTSQAPRPRFALEKRIGEGAQGVIFGVRDCDTRRLVALKTLHSAGVDGTEISRFIHEAQITAQLEHPGIVPVHDFGALPDGTVFYTMKRIEGESLAAWLRGRAADPRQRFDLLELFLRVCETVGFAHSRGVIHRDLKPRNIMVGAFGEVLVMDWGLAKVLGAPAGGARVTSLRVEGEPRDDVHRTLEGFAVGTPAYMSPEQARGESDRVDGRSDIYSLGVILYEMLCGQSPYERGDVRRTLEQVAAGRGHRLEDVAAGAEVDRRLRAITHKAMAYRQEDRYPNVDALARDLHDYLAGRAVAAHREGLAERGVRLFRRHRLPVLAGAAVAVVAVTGFAGWWANGEWKRRSAIAGLRATAAELAVNGDIESLEGARRRLDLLLELAPDDAAARAGTAALDERLRQAHEAEGQAAARAQRRDEAMRLLADADAAVAVEQSPEVLDGASRRVLQAIGLVQGDPDGDELRTRLDARYEELLTRRVQLEEGVRSARAREAQAEETTRRRADADSHLAAVAASVRAGDLAAAARQLAEARAIDRQHPGLDDAARAIDAADGESRRRACDAKLAEARAALADGERAGRVRDGAARSAVLLARRLERGGDTTVRAELAAAEQARDDAGRARDAALGRAYDLLHDADRAQPGRADVSADLAAWFLARADEAEAAGDAALAGAQLAQARGWAAGAGAAAPATTARVAVPVDGPAVTLTPIATGPDRIDAAIGPAARVEPDRSLVLPPGRYLAVGDAGAVTALRLARGGAKVVVLPPPPPLPADTAWIPGGRCWDGPGRVALDGAGAEVAVRPFAIARRETTCGEWLEFLNAPATQKLIDEAGARGRPRCFPRAGPRGEASWRRGWGGRFELVAASGAAIDPRLPVGGISVEDAQAYARWRAERDGVPWRLPTRWEWQLAAQGGDGRAFPWGERADPTRCCSLAAGAIAAGMIGCSGGSFPADRSVQGVDDLAGSLGEFVVEGDGDAAAAVLMGGDYATGDADRFATWSRRRVAPDAAEPWQGVRLAATLP